MDNNNANNDAIAARRRALAEALRQGEPVVVSPTGEVGTDTRSELNRRKTVITAKAILLPVKTNMFLILL